LSSFSIYKHPFFQWADIISYHSIHSGYFNYLALPKLTYKKPSVITLQDMWCITGHCATSYDCQKWKTGCGKCPYLDTYPQIKYDNTKLEWKFKKWAYSHSALSVVTPSRWLAECVKQSIMNHLPVHHIPYGIDTGILTPRDKISCRKILGIPSDKKILLYTAFDVTNKMKGSDIVMDVINRIPIKIRKNICLLLMGQNAEQIIPKLDVECFDMGFVTSDLTKSIIYSTADVLLYPTRADNLPFVVLESMSCGTPVVSFRIGGVPELVRPSITGLLAAPFNKEEIMSNVMELLENDSARNTMSINCRNIIKSEYTLELQAERYKNLYCSILNTNK
jgi:glycosyltransferase involved in cell wall biosynthesis